jgi:hypothetical protein
MGARNWRRPAEQSAQPASFLLSLLHNRLPMYGKAAAAISFFAVHRQVRRAPKLLAYYGFLPKFVMQISLTKTIGFSPNGSGTSFCSIQMSPFC